MRAGRNPLIPTWVMALIDCINCKGRYQLEAGDKVKRVRDQRDGDYWEVKCPNCGAMMRRNVNE